MSVPAGLIRFKKPVNSGPVTVKVGAVAMYDGTGKATIDLGAVTYTVSLTLAQRSAFIESAP